jgi:hypothetical protein
MFIGACYEPWCRYAVLTECREGEPEGAVLTRVFPARRLSGRLSSRLLPEDEGGVAVALRVDGKG